MWDADSLILLLEVSIKCVAVAECFCPLFFCVCAVDVALRQNGSQACLLFWICVIMNYIIEN